MAELIDISNDKFWDILFDEACVEWQQAKRIETALKKISVTESEIRAKAIDEFAEKLKWELGQLIFTDSEKFARPVKEQEQICHQNITLKRAIRLADYVAEQLKERE